MLRTASKLVPAVAAIAILGTGWASATTPTSARGDRPLQLASVAAEAPPPSVPPTPVTSATSVTSVTSVSSASSVTSAASVTSVASPRTAVDTAPPPPPQATTKLPPAVPAQAKGCEGHDGPYAPASEAEFRAVMTRAWLLCGAPSFFGTNEDGLDIRTDGRWSKLYRTARGSLVIGSGPTDAGTWETFDTSAMNGRPTYQINFTSDGGGTHMATPTFAGRGREVSKVHLDNMGLFVADYVPAPARVSEG